MMIRKLVRVFGAVAALNACLIGCGVGAKQPTGSATNIDAADTQVRLAVGYMNGGKYELALERLQRAVSFNSSSSEAYSTMGVLYEQINDSVNAEKSYRRAASLEPKKGAPHNNYGRFLCGIGKYEEAEREFMIALEDPFYKTPAMAATNAGTCAKLAGKTEDAERHLRRALALDPRQSGAFLPLAMVLDTRGEAMKARAFLQRHEGSGLPLNAEFFALAARVETRLGDASAAAEYLAQLGKQFPNSDEAKRMGVGQIAPE